MGAPRGNRNAAGKHHMSVSGGAKSYLNKTSGRSKVKSLLIKYGNNPSDVQKMVKKHFHYAAKHYGTASKRADVIRVIY